MNSPVTTKSGGNSPPRKTTKRPAPPKAPPSCRMRCHKRNVAAGAGRPVYLVQDCLRARIHEHDGARARRRVARFAQIDPIGSARARRKAYPDHGGIRIVLKRDARGGVRPDHAFGALGTLDAARRRRDRAKGRHHRAAGIGKSEQDAGERQHREHDHAPLGAWPRRDRYASRNDNDSHSESKARNDPSRPPARLRRRPAPILMAQKREGRTQTSAPLHPSEQNRRTPGGEALPAVATGSSNSLCGFPRSPAARWPLRHAAAGPVWAAELPVPC